MDDLISRADAIDVLIETIAPPSITLDTLVMRIDAIPSAQPKRKTGRWERHYSRPNVYADLFWHCSSCGYKTSENYAPIHYHYCPNCGADMRGEKETHGE